MSVFKLEAEIGLNKEKFEKGLKDAGENLKKFGSGVQKMASGIANVVKVAAVGIGAASAGIGAVAKQAVQNYADFEQLAGGVETLFGAGGKSLEEYAESMGKSVDEVREKYDSLMQSQDIVMKNAAEAYRTAGLSANDYMETVTGFSASLLQSLGGDTVKAAEYADRAIIDMSDNANKMGTSMEAIQNAYSGFAKGNYTMLDNLKLGYGGTGEEMKRLIADASQMTKEMEDLGVSVDGADMSFGNIVNAISVMQKHLDIAGTTQREAASTISGSLNMMKGAWQNLITGVADDSQDFDALISNFVDSVGTVAENIIPRVEIALRGVGKLVDKLVPQIIERLPELLNNTLPTLLKSVGSLLSAIGKALVSNADVIFDFALKLLQSVIDKISGVSLSDDVSKFIESLAEAFFRGVYKLTRIGIEVIKILSEAITDNAGVILESLIFAFQDIIESIGAIMPTLLELGFNLIKSIGEALMENGDYLIDTAIWVIETFAEFMAENAPLMITNIVSIITQLAEMFTNPDNIGRLVDSSIAIIMAIADGLIAALPVLLESAPVIIENLVTAVTDNVPKLLDCAWELIKEFTNALLVNLPLIIESGGKIIDSIMVGIVQVEMQLWDKVKEIRETMHERFKEMVGYAKDWGKDLIQNFIDGIKEKFTALKNKVSEVAQSVKDFLGFSEPKEGPLSNFHTYAPDMMDLYAKGIKDNAGKVTSQIESSFSDIKGTMNMDVNTEGSGGFYGGGNIYNINVTAGTISNDYDARRAGKLMSESLAELQSMEKLSRGSA